MKNEILESKNCQQENVRKYMNIKVTPEIKIEIIKLASLGIPYREIGKKLEISEGAVFYHTHPDQKDARHKYQVDYDHKAKKDVIALLGGKCSKCGMTDMHLLNINHKNGNGRKERGKHGTSILHQDILKGRREIDDLNLLCFNCNILYEYEVGRRKEDSSQTMLHNFVINKLGGKCARCGNTDLRVLEVNHINGGGREELRHIHPVDFYQSIANNTRMTNDLNVLCGNCNFEYTHKVISAEVTTLSVLDELKHKFGSS